MLVKVLDRLEEVLPDKEYRELNVKHDQGSCCICFEDFAADSIIKETVCKHVFHS